MERICFVASKVQSSTLLTGGHVAVEHYRHSDCAGRSGCMFFFLVDRNRVENKIYLPNKTVSVRHCKRIFDTN